MRKKEKKKKNLMPSPRNFLFFIFYFSDSELTHYEKQICATKAGKEVKIRKNSCMKEEIKWEKKSRVAIRKKFSAYCYLLKFKFKWDSLKYKSSNPYSIWTSSQTVEVVSLIPIRSPLVII